MCGMKFPMFVLMNRFGEFLTDHGWAGEPEAAYLFTPACAVIALRMFPRSAALRAEEILQLKKEAA